VLTAADPLRPAVELIVGDAVAHGPLVSPPPSLQITPPGSTTGPAGGLVGPYTIVSPGRPATVVAAGASMFSDATGSTGVPNGSTVANDSKLWLQSATIGTAALSATASATVPSGNVYLYSGNFDSVNDAQRLILAQTTTVTTRVSAAAQFVDSGALIVSKTIDGPGAGNQGQIVITATCGGTALPDFIIPAGTTGSVSHTYENIFPTPAECTVTETVDGSNASVTVVTVNGSQTVTVPMDEAPGNAVEAEPIGNTFDTTTTTTSTTTSTTTTTTTTEPTTTTTGPTPTTTTAPTPAPTDPGSGVRAAIPARLSSTGGHSWWPGAVALGIGALAVGVLIVLLVRRRSPAV
jgi:hypothetical protein